MFKAVFGLWTQESVQAAWFIVPTVSSSPTVWGTVHLSESYNEDHRQG